MEVTQGKLSPRPSAPQGRTSHLPARQSTHSVATGRGEIKKPSNPFDIIPPHSEDIERCVLGSMLIEHLAFEIAVEMINVESFYIERHQRLFAFFVAVHRRVHSLDEKIVHAELVKSNREEMRDYIGKLIMATPSAANVEGYCNELLRFARDRKRLNFALRIIREIQKAAAPTVG